jgi:hypothetical protein
VPIVASGVSYSRKIKSTADSNSVCEIDLVSILFGFVGKVSPMFSLCTVILALCSSEFAYACLDYLSRKFLDVLCVHSRKISGPLILADFSSCKICGPLILADFPAHKISGR